MDDISKLSDADQVKLSENTDNGPQSKEDAIKTANLPQDPGSVVKDYERYPGPT